MKDEKPLSPRTRKRIIRSAVDRIAADGIRGASMQTIGKSAGVGRALLYRHFPDKAAVLSAYYTDRLETVAAQLGAIEAFSEFTLQEQLQVFHENLLEAFTPDRPFVKKTFNRVFFPLPGAGARSGQTRALVVELVANMFQAAAVAGEIPEPVFETRIHRFMGDYTAGIVNYWLRDSSEQFTDTSLLLDKSLDLITACLTAGLANKAVDLGAFLFKKHVYPRLDSLLAAADEIGRLKRRLRERPK